MCRALAQPSAYPHPHPHPDPLRHSREHSTSISIISAGERAKQMQIQLQIQLQLHLIWRLARYACWQCQCGVSSTRWDVEARERRLQHFAIKRISAISSAPTQPKPTSSLGLSCSSCSYERENASFSSRTPHMATPCLHIHTSYNRLISHAFPELWLDRIICPGLSSST